MLPFKILLFSLALFHGFANDNAVCAQGSYPAKVDTPVVQSSQRQEARLLCATSEEKEVSTSANSLNNRIRFCVWERLQQQGRGENAFIINFNDINSQPGLYSGVSGYSYNGEGFPAGVCGLKVSFVKKEDFAKWQCTLITDERVYRGYVDLVKTPEPPAKKPQNTSSAVLAVASSRTAIDDDRNANKARPIITSYNDARSIVQPEIVVHSTSSNGSPQLIQEVKVESAGLEIKPWRGGKLIVFE